MYFEFTQVVYQWSFLQLLDENFSILFSFDVLTKLRNV